MHGHVTPRAALPIACARRASLAVSDTLLGGFVLRTTPLIAAVLFAIVFAAPAGAAVPHTVQPGETLWSIAAANNLTTRTVAAYNGLSESSQVVLGSTIEIPSTVEGYAALQKAGLVSAPAQAAAPAAPAPVAAPAAAAAPAPMGGYTVRPGDTLSGLAAGARVSVSAIAAMNGLDPERRADRRHRHQAADRRAGSRACVGAGARRHGRAAGRARRPRPRGSAPPTCSPSPPSTGSPPRWRPRSPGRRAASTTTWCRARTRAASCRSCPARGTTCSRTSRHAPARTRLRAPTT